MIYAVYLNLGRTPTQWNAYFGFEAAQKPKLIPPSDGGLRQQERGGPT